MRLVESHRQLECERYDECLAVAVRAGWRGWGCDSCPLASVAAGSGAANEPGASSTTVCGFLLSSIRRDG